MKTLEDTATEAAAKPADREWWLYLLLCENGMTYVGTTTDVAARFALHCGGKGARFTRINPPRQVIAAQPFPDRSSACKAESRLKRLPRMKKLEWATNWPWPGQ